MRAASPALGRAILGVILLAIAACAASTGERKGVTSPQPVSQCAENSSDCLKHDDCCSGWCVNGECEAPQP